MPHKTYKSYTIEDISDLMPIAYHIELAFNREGWLEEDQLQLQIATSQGITGTCFDITVTACFRLQKGCLLVR